MAINYATSAAPAAQLIADTGLLFGPLDGTTYLPIASRQVQLAPGALPPSISTIVPAGGFTPVPVSAALEINSIKGGLLLPRLTLTQRNATTFIPCNGLMIYNITDASVDIFIDGAWQAFAEGAGSGNVIGPGSATASNIAIFGDTTGKLIADSGVSITVTTGLLLATVNQIGNVGFLQFNSAQGPAVYVDTLSAFNLNVNDYGPGSLVSTVFTDGIPNASTSVSALVEIQGTNGVLMLNSLTDTEMNSLVNPQNGYIFYNSTHGLFYGREGGSFTALTPSILNIGGTNPITVTGVAGGVEISLASSGVTPGAYTNANVTVDSQGIITAITDGSGGGSGITAVTGTAPVVATTVGTTAQISLQASSAGGTHAYPSSIVIDSVGVVTGITAGNPIISIVGDAPIVASTTGGAGATTTLSFQTSGVSVGTYTNATVTVDTYGRVTAASSGSAGSGVTAVYGANGLVASPDPITGSGTVSLLPVTPGTTSGTHYKFMGATLDGSNNVTGLISVGRWNDGNLFLGPGSGNDTVASSGNIGLGNLAGSSLTSGGGNFLAGISAGGGLTTGVGNICIGNNVMSSGATTTSYNTIVGAIAGSSLTGGQNSIFGYQSGDLLTSGANNLIGGYQASNTLTTGSNNTVLGASADVKGANTSNAVVLGSLSVAESDSIAIGNTAQASQPQGIAIGTTTTASALYAVAIGPNASATTQASIAIGQNTSATGTQNSIAIGTGASSVGANSVAIGTTATVSTDNSIAIGTQENSQFNSRTSAYTLMLGGGIAYQTKYFSGGGSIAVTYTPTATDYMLVALYITSGATGAFIVDMTDISTLRDGQVIVCKNSNDAGIVVSVGVNANFDGNGTTVISLGRGDCLTVMILGGLVCPLSLYRA